MIRVSFDEGISKAIEYLQSGNIVAYPTDTFYGLGVDSQNENALKKLAKLKGGREHKPFPLLLSDSIDLKKYVHPISKSAQTLIDRFWPGALTLVFNSSHFPAVSQTVGFRVPDHAQLQKLIRVFQRPITGTSANRSRQSPAQTADQVEKELASENILLLDGGSCPGGDSSTVVDFTSTPRCIREGKISWTEITSTLENA